MMLTKLSVVLQDFGRMRLVGFCVSVVFVSTYLTWTGSQLSAQSPGAESYTLSESMKSSLIKPGDLTLRDVNFVEALFAIRRTWGVNIVVGNELKGEVISCDFHQAPLIEILDSILGPRGYGFRPIGNSLVVTKLDALGDIKPMFETATIKLEYGDAKEIQDAVSFHLSQYGRMQAVPSSKRLVILDFPQRIAIIREKVAELDEAAKDILDAAKLAEVKALEAEAARSQGLLSAPSANGSNSGGGLPQLAVLPRVVYFDLQFTKAETVAPLLLPMLSPLGRVTALPKDNRLVVVELEDRLQVVADTIKAVDVPRPQVRIAALIYDASLEDIRRCGVNWRTAGKGNSLTPAGIAKDQLILNSVTAAAPAAGAANGALQFLSDSSNMGVNVVIDCLAQSKESRLLADPNVTVYDLETADLAIVSEIPFQQLTQGLGGGSIGTTAFREAGVSLKVTPQIADDNTIVMVVNPKFSVLTGFTPATNAPIIDRRETTTTVRVANRQTIVIGGLRQRTDSRNHSGIPYLKDLKWGIGNLFRNKNETVKESELVVFITPEILACDYLGRPREIATLPAAENGLDTIPVPKIPQNPCPPDPWKHKCGIQCKHGHCRNGACPYGCQPEAGNGLAPSYEMQTDPSYHSPSYPHSVPTPALDPVINAPPSVPQVELEAAPANPDQTARAKVNRPIMPVAPNPKGPAVQSISRPKVTAKPIVTPISGQRVDRDIAAMEQTSRLPPVEVVSVQEEDVEARPVVRPLLDRPAVPPRLQVVPPKQVAAPKLPNVPPLAMTPSRAAVPAKMAPAPAAAASTLAQAKKRLSPTQPIYVGSSPSETLRR